MKYKSPNIGSLKALLPFLIFIAIYLGAGIYFQMQGVDMAFYQFPSVTAMFIAVLSAFCLGSEPIMFKFGIFSKGAANDNIMTMLMIYILAGAFSAVAAAMGGRDATVNLGISMVPAQYLTAGIFLISAFMGTATGTSMGTVAAIIPIAAGIGEKSGISAPLIIAACVGGAMFGDNLSFISDTTIASASTQEYTNKPGVADVAGVVGSRMKYALVAAAAATVCFALFGGSGSAINAAEAEAILAQYSNPKGLIMLIPVAILLIVAFIKRNIYVACTWGLISGTIIGLVSGILVPSDIMGMQDGTLGGFLIDGVNNMIGTVGYLYAIAGIIGILSASGLLQQVIDGLVHSKLNRSVVGTEVIISVGLMVSSICLGSANGPAIIMWGPIANDLGESKGLHPYRRANLMDGFGSTLPAVIPVTSAFIFIALSCIQGLMDTYSFVQEVSPVSLAGASLHCWFLFVVLAVAVITGWGRKYEGPNGEPVKALPAQTK